MKLIGRYKTSFSGAFQEHNSPYFELDNKKVKDPLLGKRFLSCYFLSEAVASVLPLTKSKKF